MKPIFHLLILFILASINSGQEIRQTTPLILNGHFKDSSVNPEPILNEIDQDSEEEFEIQPNFVVNLLEKDDGDSEDMKRLLRSKREVLANNGEEEGRGFRGFARKRRRQQMINLRQRQNNKRRRAFEKRRRYRQTLLKKRRKFPNRNNNTKINDKKNKKKRPLAKSGKKVKKAKKGKRPKKNRVKRGIVTSNEIDPEDEDSNDETEEVGRAILRNRRKNVRRRPGKQRPFRRRPGKRRPVRRRPNKNKQNKNKRRPRPGKNIKTHITLERVPMPTLNPESSLHLGQTPPPSKEPTSVPILIPQSSSVSPLPVFDSAELVGPTTKRPLNRVKRKNRNRRKVRRPRRRFKRRRPVRRRPVRRRRRKNRVGKVRRPVRRRVRPFVRRRNRRRRVRPFRRRVQRNQRKNKQKRIQKQRNRIRRRRKNLQKKKKKIAILTKDNPSDGIIPLLPVTYPLALETGEVTSNLTTTTTTSTTTTTLRPPPKENDFSLNETLYHALQLAQNNFGIPSTTSERPLRNTTIRGALFSYSNPVLQVKNKDTLLGEIYKDPQPVTLSVFTDNSQNENKEDQYGGYEDDDEQDEYKFRLNLKEVEEEGIFPPIDISGSVGSTEFGTSVLLKNEQNHRKDDMPTFPPPPPKSTTTKKPPTLLMYRPLGSNEEDDTHLIDPILTQLINDQAPRRKPYF